MCRCSGGTTKTTGGLPIHIHYIACFATWKWHSPRCEIQHNQCNARKTSRSSPRSIHSPTNVELFDEMILLLGGGAHTQGSRKFEPHSTSDTSSRGWSHDEETEMNDTCGTTYPAGGWTRSNANSTTTTRYVPLSRSRAVQCDKSHRFFRQSSNAPCNSSTASSDTIGSVPRFEGLWRKQ